MEIIGAKLQEILNDDNDEFKVIDKYYEFLGEDHDLWEFQAIIQHIATEKFYSVNWYDCYVGWWECGLDEDMFELTEVFPKEVIRTEYEV